MKILIFTNCLTIWHLYDTNQQQWVSFVLLKRFDKLINYFCKIGSETRVEFKRIK